MKDSALLLTTEQRRHTNPELFLARPDPTSRRWVPVMSGIEMIEFFPY
jgi:hypothetical protein